MSYNDKVKGKVCKAEKHAINIVNTSGKIVEAGSAGNPQETSIWQAICEYVKRHDSSVVSMLEESDFVGNNALLALYTYLTLLPNMTKLLGRILLDEEAPFMAKAVGIAAIGYVLNVMDLIPDVIPLVGGLDDLGVLSIVFLSITGMISGTPEEILEKHWDGRDITIQKIKGLADTLSKLVNPSAHRSEAIRRIDDVGRQALEVKKSAKSSSGERKCS
jgi:uncharacterized membrane protein YkvA (DUF1232 family)